MATRSRTSFQKRQKEIARMEKQRDKAARRLERKLNPSPSDEDLVPTAPGEDVASEENAGPEGNAAGSASLHDNGSSGEESH